MLYIGFINFFKENARSWPVKDTSRVSHVEPDESTDCERVSRFIIWNQMKRSSVHVMKTICCEIIVTSGRVERLLHGAADSIQQSFYFSSLCIFWHLYWLFMLTFIKILYSNKLYLSEIVLVTYHLFPFLFMSKLYLYINTNNCICCVLAAVIGQIQIMWSHRGSNAC